MGLPLAEPLSECEASLARLQNRTHVNVLPPAERKVTMRHSRLAAWWITGVGVLHCALFLWFGRSSLRAIAGEGFWNTIDPFRERQVLFWALLTGVLALVLGQLALWVTKQGKPLPASLGWQLLVMTLVAGLLMPVSGGWLLTVPAILIIVGARASERAGEP